MYLFFPLNFIQLIFTSDMGYKGTDMAMTYTCSELDYLDNGMTNYVPSAELHNQFVGFDFCPDDQRGLRNTSDDDNENVHRYKP